MMAKLPRLNYINIFFLFFSLVLYSDTILISNCHSLVAVGILQVQPSQLEEACRHLRNTDLYIVVSIALVDAADVLLRIP